LSEIDSLNWFFELILKLKILSNLRNKHEYFRKDITINMSEFKKLIIVIKSLISENLYFYVKTISYH
jgi:hypothetical protein